MWRSTLPFLALAAACLSAAGAEPDSEPVAPAAEGEAVLERFVPPQIILGTQEQPVFPPAAWKARFTGSVLLEMTVMKDGTVDKLSVVECTRPKMGFEDAAVAAVRQWRFEPGLEAGEAVEVTTRIRLNFTRVGVGLAAKPQVSAGSFSVASRELEPGGNAGSGAPSGASDRK